MSNDGCGGVYTDLTFSSTLCEQLGFVKPRIKPQLCMMDDIRNDTVMGWKYGLDMQMEESQMVLPIVI